MTDAKVLETAAAHWDKSRTPAHTRYWQFPQCIRAINRRIGFDTPDWSGALISSLRKRTGGKQFARAVSIGCGGGGKELEFIKAGVVEQFDLFEISQSRIEIGRRLYASAFMTERGHFYSANGLEHLAASPNYYDLVLWDNSLHHMATPREALQLSLTALKSGGALILNEFIGPIRFQFSDRDLLLIENFRRSLPERFFDVAAGARLQVARRVSRPKIEDMLAVDPTEAIDSEAILPAVKELMPEATVWMLGGVIYHLGLNDVLGNFRLPEDEALLQMALYLDEVASMAGFNHFAAGLFVKP